MRTLPFLFLVSLLFPLFPALLPNSGWGGLTSIQTSTTATCSISSNPQTTPGICVVSCPSEQWTTLEAVISNNGLIVEKYDCRPKPILSRTGFEYVYDAVETRVKVIGTNFYYTQWGVRCKYGETVTKGHLVSQYELECEWAPLLSGKYALSVSFNRMDWSDAVSVTVKTTPRIVSLMTSGEYLPATITVTGVHFSTGLLCALSDGSQASLTVIDTHSGTCAVPGTVEGAVDVRIVDLGLIALSRNFTFAYKKRVTILQTYPSFVLSNSKVEVYGKSFDSSMQCAFNGNVAKTVFKFENRLECATSNVPAGTYLLSIRNAAGLDITEQPVSVVVNIASYTLVGTQTSSRDTLIVSSPQFPTGDLFCRYGLSKSVKGIRSGDGVICPTSQIRDIGRFCVEISMNHEYDFSSDCQVSVTLPRTSRTLTVQPTEICLAGGNLTIAGIRFYPDNNYKCRVIYPDTEVHIITAIMNSPFLLECDLPASHLPGSARVSVLQDYDIVLEEHLFVFIAYISLASISPSRVMLGGGTTLTISGRDIPSPNTCFFTAASGLQYPTPALTVSSTQVTCRSPDLSSEGPGTVQISLTEFDGSPSHYLEVSTVSSPTITSLLPDFAFEDLEADIYIAGSGFMDVPELAVHLGVSEQSISATFISSELIRATIRILLVNHFSHTFEAISVSVNGQDFSASVPLSLYPCPSLGVLSISKGLWQGNFTISIFGNGFKQPGECMFEENSGPAEAVSYHEMKCLVPLSNPGKYQVRIRVLGHEFSLRPVYFQFKDFSEYWFTPKSGPLVGGTIVTLVGDFKWITAADKVYCSFGGQLSTATMSDSDLVCVSPPHSQSEVVYLHLIVNDFDYSQTEVVLQQYFYEKDPELGNISTFVWTSIGGTLIDLSGAGFQLLSNWKCHIGAFTRDLFVLSPYSAICFSPHTLFGLKDVLKISGNGQHFLQFHEVCQIVPDPSIYTSEPALGPRAGGTVVTIYGNYLADVVVCRFGSLQSVPANIVDSHTITCVSPAWETNASVYITVSVNNQMFTETKVPFAYYDLPYTHSVVPGIVPRSGGTIATILGAGFANPTFCRINEAVRISTFVSSTEIRIVTPATPAGLVTIDISFNGQQYHSFQKAAYTAYADLGITAITPRHGVAGTIVTVTGVGFEDIGALSCSFSNTKSQWIYLIDSTTLKCKAPQRPAGPAIVSISINGLDFVTFEAFTYHWELEVISSRPVYTSPSGGTEFTLSTVNWPSDVSLALCRFILTNPETHTSTYTDSFHDYYTVASSVAGRIVKCVSPQNYRWGDVTAKVVVTSEQQRYSYSGAKVEYYEGSFDGFYRTGSGYVECEMGQFCRREKWYSMSSCERGYWQGSQRQRRCKVCTPGNCCPERAMAEESACLSGTICPVHGSTYPLLDCPAGFYCVSGTASSSFWDDSPHYLKPIMCTILGSYCPAGTPKLSAGLKCTTGFYCPWGSKDHNGVIPCISGYYCQESVVIPCPPRYFCPDRSNIVPHICPPGTYNPYTNQSKCLPCSYGYICPHSGMLFPQVCPIGYICNRKGLTNPIEMCAVGYYCDGIVMTSFTSRPCRVISDFDALTLSFCSSDVMFKKSNPDNISANMPLFTEKPENMCCWNQEKTANFFYQIGLSTNSLSPFARLKEAALTQAMTGMDLYRLLASSPAFRELSSSTRSVDISLIRPSDISNFNEYIEELLLMKQPQPCPPGMFCLKKTGSNSTDSRRLPPYECNPGTYCKLAASTPQGTGLCPAGYYCPAGTSTPIKTAQGYRAEFQGNVNPAPCMPGFFSNQDSAASCQSCPSGFECPTAGTIWPLICPPGMYRTSGSMSRCAPCPVRSWTSEKGVTALPFCLPCVAGRLCSQPGIKSVSQTYPCIEGDICEEASDIKSRSGCPAGYLCPMDTAPFEAFANECKEGFFCKFRTPMRNKYLLQCPAFAYCPHASTDYEAFYLTELSGFQGLFPPTICSMGTGGDGKAGKKHLLECRINDEYASDSRTHLMELSPVDTNLGTPPSGFLAIANSTFPLDLPYYDLRSLDLMLITIDLRHLHLASDLKYGRDWSLAISVSFSDVHNRVPADMPLNFLNETVAKNSVLEFSLDAWSTLTATVSVLIYNGLMLSERDMFLSIACVEIFSPNRANFGSRDVITAYFSTAVSLPVNIPAEDASKKPDYLLGFAQSPRRYKEMMTPRVEGKNWFVPNSLFWQGGDSYMIPYLPYFSNCKGYGAYIPIWALFELNPQCDLVAPENTSYVSSFDFGTRPRADSCSNITIDCVYDEIPGEQEPLPRWWELPFMSTLFEVSETPVSISDFLSGTEVPKVPVTVMNLGVGRGLPRNITLDIRYQQLDPVRKKIITATITFSDFLEPTSAQSSGADITKYKLNVNFSALSHMELMVLFQFPISFYSVLNLLVGSVMIACCATFLCYHRLCTKASPVPKVKFWGYFVMTLPPIFGGMALAMIPVYSVLFFISVFVQGNLWTYIIQFPDTDVVSKTKMGIFDQISPSYDSMEIADMTTYRYCRVGISLMLLALYLLSVSSTLFIPSTDQQHALYHEDSKGNILNRVYWQRFSFSLISLLTCCGCLLLVFFSYSSYFAINFYPCLVAMQVIGWVFEESVGPMLGSLLLRAPIMSAVSVVQGMCFFGAGTFVDYLQGAFLDFTVMLYNRVYHSEIVGMTVECITNSYKKAKKLVKTGAVWNRQKSIRIAPEVLLSSDREMLLLESVSIGQEETSLRSMEEIASDSSDSYYTIEEIRASEPVETTEEAMLEQHVEPLLDEFGGYAADTVGVVYMIILTTYLWYFYDATQIAAKYGLELTAIPQYFLFSAMMLPITLILDVFLHNCNEYFNGWAIHDFLDHCSQRFRSRTTRWALFDTQKADFVDKELRSLYLTCFSSQFYFMITIHCSGMVILVVAMHTIVVNANYNVFQDRALMVLIPFVVGVCAVVHAVSVYCGKKVGLWKIQKEEKTEETQQQEENFREMVEVFMRRREPKPVGVVPSISNWSQIYLLKAGDEVIERELKSERLKDPNIRKMFLAENRLWLQENIENILTTKSLKKHHAQLIGNFKDIFGTLSRDPSPRSYSDRSSQTDAGEIAPSTAAVLQYWIKRAQIIYKLRCQTHGLILSQRQTRCMYCGSFSTLQSELIESIEDLFFRFKKQQRIRYRFRADEWDVGEWLAFVEANGHFRTLCLKCLESCDDFNIQAAKHRSRLTFTRTVHYSDPSRVVSVDSPLRVIVSRWLSSARSRLKSS